MPNHKAEAQGDTAARPKSEVGEAVRYVDAFPEPGILSNSVSFA